MNCEFLSRRAELIDQLRTFFRERGFLEVDTPLVDAEIIPEAHIDPFVVPGLGYLQASPEMYLKRLLCAGAGPIFQVTKCFRAGERGRLHRPEFTLIEWCRPGDDMQAGMALLDELMQHLLDAPPAKKTSYRQAFVKRINLDPFTAPIEQLQQSAHDTSDNRDELLNLLLATQVETTLGSGAPEILHHYPAGQSALAKTILDDQGAEVAERFELYYRGVELANGYHELTDAAELRRRLVAANAMRVSTNRSALPLPEKLLAAMEDPGLPACAGVAVGFDRLLMLAAGADSLDEVTM